MITLFDAWGLEPELYGTAARWVPWYPVDHEPLPDSIRSKIGMAWRRIAFSRFGARLTTEADLSVSYVPHCVDTSVFRAKSQYDARVALDIPIDSFVVGMVAANKGFPSRKALPQCLQSFAEFKLDHGDAIMVLHTDPGNSGRIGADRIDIPKLVKALDLERSVVVADAYYAAMGCNQEHMINLYSAFDVLLSPSLGEGFGVPILEAQSCGCPVIVGEWTSMEELCFAGWKIPKNEAERLWTPLGAWQFVPHIAAIASALKSAYEERNRRRDMALDARAGALAYDTQHVGESFWKVVLNDMASELGISDVA